MIGASPITIIGNPATGNGSVATLSFTTMQTPSGTSPVADGPNDTLTFSTDGTITITGNATSDSITFAARVASSGQSGIVSTTSQNFLGTKTFYPTTSSAVGVQIAAQSGQTADLFQVLGSVGQELLTIDKDGTILSNGFGGGFEFISGNLTLNEDRYAHVAQTLSGTTQITLPQSNIDGRNLLVINATQQELTVCVGVNSVIGFGGTSIPPASAASATGALYISTSTNEWTGIRIGEASDPNNPPVGSIIAWHKSLTGVPSLPANYVECNGGTISNANSPMNGGSIPDLNTTQYFLRGQSTSGSTGGTINHNHDVGGISVDPGTLTPTGYADLSGISILSNDAPADINYDILTANFVQSSYFSCTIAPFTSASLSGCGSITPGSNTANADNIPPYFEVVWVMRIY